MIWLIWPLLALAVMVIPPVLLSSIWQSKVELMRMKSLEFEEE